jgi:ornithine carbamoyltransferase
MAVRHLLSLSELGLETISHLIKRTVEISKRAKVPKPLVNRVVGLYFRRHSTRTRSAFTVGAIKLGAATVVYQPDDLQILTGESLEDTARVLSGYLDAFVMRTNGPIHEMEAFANQSRMAVINAMSANEHPTQAIADLATIYEAFGRHSDVHVLYIGEGNNTASALAYAASVMPGLQLTLVTPQGYGLPECILDKVKSAAKQSGAFVTQHHNLDELPKRVDVVYTTRWQTMGEPKPDANWKERFGPYRVTPALMAQVSKPLGTIFMHDLPAIRGSDVTDDVLDGPQSWAFKQAQHKLTSAMAILEWCITGQAAVREREVERRKL